MNEQIQVGRNAPKFSCEAYHNGQFKKVSLDAYMGQWVVMFFYPRDFTFVCPTELKGFANRYNDFLSLNAQIIAVSTDSIWSHKTWFETELKDVQYPVLADSTHVISRNYGVLLEETGEALRGTFIIAPDGILRYYLVSDTQVGRSVDETLRVLQALQTGGLCPMNWKKGDNLIIPETEKKEIIENSVSEIKQHEIAGQIGVRDTFNTSPQGF